MCQKYYIQKLLSLKTFQGEYTSKPTQAKMHMGSLIHNLLKYQHALAHLVGYIHRTSTANNQTSEDLVICFILSILKVPAKYNRESMTNIKFKNVVVRNSLLFPIVLRCNETNPCINVTFENVQAKGWLIGKKNKGYVCENVQGSQQNCYPQLDCLTSVDEEMHNLMSEQMQNKQLFGSYDRLIQKMQAAAREIGYHEQDDEMNLNEEEIRQDCSMFSQEQFKMISIA